MPVRNGAGFLDRSIGSVLRQTFTDWELLAVDDGSTDDSYARLERFAAADARIRCIQLPENRGVAAARNRALREARGELIAYLDMDDEYYPDYLEAAQAHRRDADVLVFAYDLAEERPTAPNFGRTYTWDPGAARHLLMQQHIAVPLGVAHQRSLLAQTGMFAEAPGVEEDTDLWQRFARAGARFKFLPARSGLYHIRADSLARTRPPVRPNPPARVMFASYHCYLDPTSGAALCVRDLLELLAARGWPCTVFCGPRLDTGARPIEELLRDHQQPFDVRRAPGDGAVAVYHYERHGVPATIYQHGQSDPGPDPTRAEGLPFLALFERALDHFQPDVLLTYGGHWLAQEIIAAARRRDIPVVFWLHNFAYHHRQPFAQASAVLVPSCFARDHYRERLGLECFAIPGPWNWERVRCPQRDGRYVTFVNPHPAKGLFLFARLADELHRVRPDIPLLIVEGRGKADWLGHCGLDLTGLRNLFFMKNTPDPRDFYAVSRLVLMPSLWWESFPRVAVEAMINGIPVLGSRRGGLPETLAEAGFLFDVPTQYTPESREVPTPKDVALWVDAIIRLWDDPVFLLEESRKAAAAAEAWRPEVLAGRFEDFLWKCMQKSREAIKTS